MATRRQHCRIECDSHCLVIGQTGDTYQAFLSDISLSGASVAVYGETPFEVGDVCDLVLNDASAVFPLKRTGKVVRRASDTIGLSFTM